MPESPLFSFPSPPSADAAEWPGTPMGVSNAITRTKGRTAVHDKVVDATPGLLDRLLRRVREHQERTKTPVAEHDVVIHGIRVRATTNSPHLGDFWRDNWYSLKEWREFTGQEPPAEPAIRVYALCGVKDEQEAAYYSRSANTIVFFNTAYYGQLKSWVLGAVGRILAADFGIHSIHGACVELDGKGVLYIAPTGTGKSTSSYGMMTYPRSRFHSDDWVYVRYTYATRDGGRVFVLGAKGTDGSRARGYQVYRWIESHARDAQARLNVMTADHRAAEIALGDLDLSKPLEAFAYTSEKVFYLRTNLAENFPLSTGELLASKEENVPDVSDAFLREHRPTLDNMMADLNSHMGEPANTRLRAAKPSELAETCARLIAFDNARSMLDISRVLPRERIFANPLEPVRLAAVFLLKRDPASERVLDHISLDDFMERLLIGETPEKKRETAYNAYRAVDDKAERALIERLEKQAASARPLYSLFAGAGDKPASLDEEFELFRVMYNAARTYDLNTTLQRDPRVRDKRQAVARTLALIARAVREEPTGIHLTLKNYGEFID